MNPNIIYRDVDGQPATGKTFQAFHFAARKTNSSTYFIIAQPSRRLNRETRADMRKCAALPASDPAWIPNVPVMVVNSDTTENVAETLMELSKETHEDGLIVLCTHAGLLDCPYFHKGTSRNAPQWHMIGDEAFPFFWHHEIRLQDHRQLIDDILELTPHGLDYSLISAKDKPVVKRFADHLADDEWNDTIADLCAKILSPKWSVYTQNEQWHRFVNALEREQDPKGRLSFFALLDPHVFDCFSTVTMMGANIHDSIGSLMMRQTGIKFEPHSWISKNLKKARFPGGRLTIIYGAEERWSKRRRNTSVKLPDGTYTDIGQAMADAAMMEFGDEPFAFLINHDLDKNSPFGEKGTQLPFASHGLNSFGHLNAACVIPALNPTPLMFNFLDSVAHLDPEHVIRAVCHEQVLQASARIFRDPDDPRHKTLFVADRDMAEHIGRSYPGATLRHACFPFELPDMPPRGQPRKYECNAEKCAAYQASRKDELSRQLRVRLESHPERASLRASSMAEAA